MKINVMNGKYTFCHAADGYSVEILRYGEPWHQQSQASNAIHSLMAELDAARVVLKAARAVVKANVSDPEPIIDLVSALERHDALVDDHEPPSECSAL